ncbi:uncharacterized protein LOC123704717 [Colias croceus]|uniref:uncharacterized protein LOC123704717 n=1 Tax=Colias crocea TaxID=72248 RepID=UPI001E2801CB|nr:uncharacterized protein LOC123704717 [Colias croceus]
MFLKWRALVVLWLAVALAEDTPPGLVSKDDAQDLVAEASQPGQQAQKRDSGLSNSYGEPLPPDAYGPPRDIINTVPDSSLPAPVYGVPETLFIDTPPGAYGPPAPVVFPSQNYEGPPPPLGKPKPIYGPPKFHPPKNTYGPPKPVYGPPKKNYGPPKQVLPKPNYGAPFKPPKFNHPKPVYGVPKPVYGPPKQVYGPPKLNYGAPLNFQNIQVPDLPSNYGTIGIGANVGSTFSTVETSIGTNFGSNLDFNSNLPAPIYGTPFPNLPVNLKPNFPIPSDSYGPPGLPLGPIGPNDQIVVQDFGSIGHYGPPQPDPNPRPPHPGIPAPPTPPHVLYDGWKPIPGVSKPLIENVDIHTIHNVQGGHIESLDQYGPPPPPPPSPELLNIDAHSHDNFNQQSQFGAQISSGYSTVHQDALANIDLNAIVGGDSNHIDQSKTVFEAHYTENSNPHADLSFIQSAIQNEKPINAYGPPPEPISFPVSIRQQGAKGLLPPSSVYGVPSNQYGPPRQLPANLPIPYGSVSGGGHSLHSVNNGPRHPIKFRESVPEGLIQQIGQISQHKDHHGVDHVKTGPAYLPPPVREVKDINQQTGNHGVANLALSIEPSNLYSLPHSGNPINFQQQQPSNLYGSPIDSYSVPLLTVADHTASGSSNTAVTASLDGTILANLSNLEAAAILKHCPYHEAILKAARSGEKIPSDLAASYVASLSSLGTAFHNNQQLISSQNSFNTPVPGSESVSYNSKDLSSASHTLVQTILPSNQIESEKTVRSSVQKGKSLKDESKNAYKQNSIQLADQIYQTSEQIRNLSEETKLLQQKIVSTSQNINQGNQIENGQNNQATYSVQIQSSDDGKGKSSPTIPHEQLLSEGLLQSILQAIEQPHLGQKENSQNYQIITQNTNYQPNFSSLDGLDLPAGYEPIDRTKSNDLEVQSSNKDEQVSDQKHKHTKECDLRGDNSIRHEIIVPPPGVEKVQKLDDVDNDVAIYFGDEKSQETVTEISVATSISEESDKYESKEFGDKTKS